MTRVALLIVVVAVAAAVALGTNAFDSSESDRAGGEHPAEPPAGPATTLTLADLGDEAEVLQVFAEKVEGLSNGTLRIRREINWGRRRRGNGEVNLIHDVQAGKADLGWAGSRAFDLVDDRAFGPLHAPMMIDSYALELKVLEDEGVVRPMLESLDRLGLDGVGVLPGPLQRPLATRRLGAPADWSGMRIGYANGEQIARSLRALGARPRIMVASGKFTGLDGGKLTGLDGLVSHFISIAGNQYHRKAPYLTGNVVLWPRPLVLFAADTVTPAQLAVLRRAADASATAVGEELRSTENDRLAVICHHELKVVVASESALARLRRAFEPVYTQLEADGETRSALARIERIASSLGEPTDAVSCEDQAPPSAAAIPDGTYEVTVTPRDSLRAGIPPNDKVVRAGAVHWTLKLQEGNYVLGGDLGEHPRPGEGTYSVYRDRIELTTHDGVLITARWSFEDGSLRFEDASVPGSAFSTRYARALWSSHPWTKVP